MAGFLTELTKPYWWISVVVVGIMINIFSEFIKKILEQIYSRFSHQVSEKITKDRDVFNKEVESLNDPNALLNAKTDLIYLAILITLYTAMYLFLLTIFTLSIQLIQDISYPIPPQVFFLLMTLAFFGGYMAKFRKAIFLERILRKFYERQGKKRNPYGIL